MKCNAYEIISYQIKCLSDEAKRQTNANAAALIKTKSEIEEMLRSEGIATASTDRTNVQG